MTTTIQINEKDIKKIIAHYFGVEEKYVDMIHCTAVEGYGMSEHIVPKIKAEIIKEQDLKTTFDF